MLGGEHQSSNTAGIRNNAHSGVREKVYKIVIDKLGLDPSEVNDDSTFTDDLGADSLDTVELIMTFEYNFNMQIPDRDAENIATVGQAVDYLVGRAAK